MPDFVTGDREIVRLFERLPNRAAQQLQAAIISNLQDAKREVIRSSTFKNLKASQLRGMIRIEPRPRSAAADQQQVRRIADVRGELFSVWQGPGTTAEQRGAAARIEKTVGGGTIRPGGGKRFLPIPLGDLRTPSGAIRRTPFGEATVKVGPGRARRRTRGATIADLEDTFLLKRGGIYLVMQKLGAGRVGVGERAGARERAKQGRVGTIMGVRNKRLGERTRLVGVLVPQARQTTPLDFFGAWDRLASKRTERYGRMLDRLTRES